MQHLIELRNVNKYYNGNTDKLHALKDVSFYIDKGEFVAITGSSGSGKSTLMNILGCLDTPTTGKYTLSGTDVMKMGENKKARLRNREIGFIFQGFNLIQALTAIENVQLPLIYRGVPISEGRRLAEMALDMVGLSARMHHKPYELSGGQQQRVAVARAVAAKPPIILADEPTGNLDSATGVKILNILQELNNRGRTIILITHDASVAQKAKRQIKVVDGIVLNH